MASFGVSLGAHSPFQNVRSMPATPASLRVGTSGAGDQRPFPATA